MAKKKPNYVGIATIAVIALIIYVAIDREIIPFAPEGVIDGTEQPIGGGSGGGSGGSGGGATPTSYSLTLDINPNNICVGDSVTAIVSSNMPGASCSIYYETSLIPGWFLYKGITLSKSGTYTETQTLSTEGSITFYVTCRYNNQNIDSNYETVVVDDCNGGGGETYTCSDTDGGINANTWGVCSDSYNQASYPDVCETIPGSAISAVREYYCGTDNKCASTLIQCSALAGLTCRDGRCTTI